MEVGITKFIAFQLCSQFHSFSILKAKSNFTLFIYIPFRDICE